jgi:hypothetical protein
LVQEVIAAITTEPWLRLKLCGPWVTVAEALRRASPSRAFSMSLAALAKVAFISLSGTRSCGRAGPARQGTTVLKSSSSVSL